MSLGLIAEKVSSQHHTWFLSQPGQLPGLPLTISEASPMAGEHDNSEALS